MDKTKKTSLKNCISKIWKSEILSAITLNLLFLASILVFCDVKYEVSDDFVMSAILSGAYGGSLNPHLIFINVLWGYLLTPFYLILPEISWYLIFQLLLCFLSFTILSYMLLKKLNRSMALMVITLLLTVFGSDAYILMQFTKTAMIAVMAGSLVFLWALFEQRSLRIEISAAILCVIGTWFRFNIIYLAGGFLLFILIVEIVRVWKNETDHRRFWLKMRKIISAGLLLILVVTGCKLFDDYSYNKDPEYKYFKEYSEARAAIVDASDYGYEAYAEELQKIGISENDYKMMRNWNFADNEVFSLDIMQKAADIIQDYKKNVEISKEGIIEEIQNRGLQGYPVFLACVVLTILSIVFQRKNCWTAIVIWGIGFAYILYCFLIERTVYRTEYAVFLGGFLTLFYFWKKLECENKREFIEYRRVCVIINTVCLFLQLPLYLPDRSYQDVDSWGRKEYIENTFYESWNYKASKYRKIVNKGAKSEELINEIETHKENLYLLDFQTMMQVFYYDWNPWKAIPTGEFDNVLYLAGVTTNFPDCNQILQTYDAEQPLKALINEKVYLVDSEWKTLDQKVQYLQERYYPEAKAELYKELDGYQIWKFSKE